MGEPAAYNNFGHIHFITFSCYKRRRILDDDSAKRIVLGVLSSQLGKQQAGCAGFVVMPDHVHALIWFKEAGQLSHFMKQWKQRSSVNIKRNMNERRTSYADSAPLSDPVWQEGYYSFNVYSQDKLVEKLNYMHHNPVKVGLVARPGDWQFSSARHYLLGRSVGVCIGMPA
ncbi:MAG: transposase [Pseudomonadota bacterium]